MSHRRNVKKSEDGHCTEKDTHNRSSRLLPFGHFQTDFIGTSVLDWCIKLSVPQRETDVNPDNSRAKTLAVVLEIMCNGNAIHSLGENKEKGHTLNWSVWTRSKCLTATVKPLMKEYPDERPSSFKTLWNLCLHVQFSSVPWLSGSSGGHEGQFSRDRLPVFSSEGPGEQFWHGHGCPLFDVPRPAFPLTTTASPTLQGALKYGFKKAVVVCDTLEPCKFPSLDSLPEEVHVDLQGSWSCSARLIQDKMQIFRVILFLKLRTL